jgi:hypothetical protein
LSVVGFIVPGFDEPPPPQPARATAATVKVVRLKAVCLREGRRGTRSS